MNSFMLAISIFISSLLGLTACQSSHGMRANGQAPFALPTPTPSPTMGSKCGTMVTLRWTAPTTNTDGTVLTDLAGYKLYYGTQSKTYSQIIDISDPASASKDITGLAPGIYYFAGTAYAGTPGSYRESDYTNEIPFELLACTRVVLNPMTGKVEYQKLDAVDGSPDSNGAAEIPATAP